MNGGLTQRVVNPASLRFKDAAKALIQNDFLDKFYPGTSDHEEGKTPFNKSTSEKKKIMSSINPVSNASSLYSSSSSSSNPAQLFQRLSNALKNNDLEGAQNAFSALQRTAGTPPGGGDSTINSDISSLSKALQSGDLSGAKSAFSSLQSGLQTAFGGHRPSSGSSSQGASDSSSNYEQEILDALLKNNKDGSSYASSTSSSSSDSVQA